MKNLSLLMIAILMLSFIQNTGCKKTTIGSVGGSGGGGGTGTGGGSGTGGFNNSKPPVANAGPDQAITILNQYPFAILNGLGSYDSSWMTLQFAWRQIAGPTNSSIPNPGYKECTVNNINTPGVYSFELKVWNNNGSDLDTTDITVMYPSYCQPDRAEIPVSLSFLSDLPGQIQDPQIITAGNKLIIPAWFNNATSTISNNIYMYDRITQNWTTIQASLARIGATTIAAGNKVFFAGGSYMMNNDFITTSVVDIYDITTNTWTVTNLSEAREGCAAVVSGNKIFFAGGTKNMIEFSNKVDIYDLETNSWSSSSLPGGARIVSAAVSVMNKVLFCGGLTEFIGTVGGIDYTTPTASIDIYDNNTGQWSAATMQVSKSGFAASNVNEKVYFAGGFVNNAATFHVEELNVNTMSSSSSCLHQPCPYGNAVIKNDKIIFLGSSYYAGIAVNRFDIFNALTGEWSVGVLPPDLANNNSGRSIASVNNEVFMVIGTKLYKMNL